MFNVSKSDNQLLDMVVNFGEFFPLLDPHGNQMQPGKKGKSARYMFYIF